MFRRSGENLHSIYILLFLNIAFYFLQIQDVEKYVSLFAFERSRFLGGEVWRIVTYQFIQGSFLGSSAVSLFFTLLILYIMGSAVEEEWGTFDFIAFTLISTVGSAAVAFFLGFPLLGSFVVSYSLLFVYATMYPQQSFLIFLILQVKVRWIAYAFLAILLFGALRLDGTSLAALVGAGLSYGYFLSRFRRYRPVRIRRHRPPLQPEKSPEVGSIQADRNLARYREMREALEGGDEERVESLVRQFEPEVVAGVNICPPVDYKPENEDRYCIRCEGFAECSIRHARLQRETAGTASDHS